MHVDNHVLAIFKPAGVPSVPDDSGDESALDVAKDWVRERYAKPGAVFLGVVHRLDRPVCGVLAFARTSKAASRMSAAFRDGRVDKVYLGLSEGEPREREGVIEQWLVKDEVHNKVRAVDHSRAAATGAKLARTVWRVLSRSQGRALFELRPASGRAHQLRHAALALAGPLCGDRKYGARAPWPSHALALFALRLELPHPTVGDRLRIEVPHALWPDWAAPARAAME